MKRYIAALFAVLVLAGCGQKGPLFLPEQTATQSAEPVQQDLRQQPTED
ncbi:MAG: LPS translocon maturation chaperone LptM [Pseudomonas sp.]